MIKCPICQCEVPLLKSFKSTIICIHTDKTSESLCEGSGLLITDEETEDANICD